MTLMLTDAIRFAALLPAASIKIRRAATGFPRTALRCASLIFALIAEALAVFSPWDEALSEPEPPVPTHWAAKDERPHRLSTIEFHAMLPFSRANQDAET